MERFSIDDAIKLSKIIANRYKWSAENADMGSEDANELNKDICNQYVKEYEQIAKWLEELKAYKELEEQGLLVRFPCKVGDVVYVITRFCSGGIKDCDYTYECSECPNYKPEIDYKRFKITMLNSVGKTVFLTREEAERKLEEVELNEK